ncbi:MAG: two-component regulator propeller domain-containing protein [Bacteroidia bacterium]
MKITQHIVYWEKLSLPAVCFYMKVSPLAFLLSAWICLASAVSVTGQPNDLRFEHFGMEDGLPNMTIQAITTDHNGYLWLGTWDGLSKYDGSRFVNFYPTPPDSLSLSFQDITGLDVDSEGKLWIATQGGLNCYNPLNGKFRQFLPEWGNPTAIGRHFCQKVYCGKDGKVYISIGYSSTIDIYLPECRGFDHVEISGVAYDFLEMKDTLWIATNKGLYILPPGENRAAPGEQKNEWMKPLSGKDIRCFQPGLKGEIWIGTLDGLYCYYPETQHLQHWDESRGLSHPYVLSLTMDNQGGIWAGTSGGLNYLPTGAERFSVFRHNPNNPFSLTNDVVISLHIDKGENLWAGTAYGGLNKVRLRPEKKFKTWNHTHFGARNRELMVFHFAEGNENRLWVATNQGLFLLDKSTKKIVDRYSYNLSGKTGLSGNGIFSVYEDAHSTVYVGIMGVGLDVIHLKTGVITHYRKEENSPLNLAGKEIRVIRESSFQGKRTIWLATNSGWSGHDPENDMSCTVTMDSDPRVKWNGYLWDILPDDSTLWFISSGGLYYYNLEQKKFIIGGWNPFRSGINTLFYPVSLLRKNHDLWLGTYGAGLLHYHISTGNYEHYRISDGLPNNMVYGILEDSNHHLWMSTNRGISRMNIHTRTFTNYTTEDGLQDEEFASGAYLKSEEGEMFFGGMNGFTSFYPDSIGEDNSIFVPKTMIQSLRVSGENVLTDTTWQYRKEIRLPGYQNQHLEISFVSTDLSHPAKNRYQFMLEGYDETWSLPTEKTLAQYTRIPPGTYRFLVRGSNSDGVLGEQVTQLRIILTPLWYQRGWIKYGVPAALFLLMIYLIFLRIRRLRMEERLRLNYRIAMVKQEALAAQMDHHFTFNSLNSIQRYLSENDKNKAIRYISRFGQLLRRTLDHAQKNYLTIEEELTTLDLYLSLEKLRTKDRFVYEFVIDPEVDVYNTEIPTNLLQPYLENAIWHGIMPLENRQGKIVINFDKKDHLLQCTIQDNGIGRKKSAELRAASQLKHNSRGTELILERIETLNTLDHTDIRITIEDLEYTTHETGTRVVVTMPFHT